MVRPVAGKAPGFGRAAAVIIPSRLTTTPRRAAGNTPGETLTSSTGTPNDPVVTSYAHAPARTVTAGGITYAYREPGPKGGIPVVFFVHLAATLDNWDPRIVDPIAKSRHVIAFDQRGVGASTGQVPDSIEAMADDAYTFITALGFDKIDVLSFSLGGFVAQALVSADLVSLTDPAEVGVWAGTPVRPASHQKRAMPPRFGSCDAGDES